MNVAIMQPYFFPYIGYFQLIHSVDLFVLYDNIEYTKKGWINRNQLLRNGEEFGISLPLTKQSDYLDIRERVISSTFNQGKLLNQIKGAYVKAPYFKQTFPMIEEIVNSSEHNLFEFLFLSIVKVCSMLGVDTKIRRSSDINVDHTLKNKCKVLTICKALGASTYINAIGGQELYSAKEFDEKGLKLKFLLTKSFEYNQFGNNFRPQLSIIDVMMFNSIEVISKKLLDQYELV